VLFACALNSVRSPMAVGLFRRLVGRGTYVASAGVRKGDLDPLAVAASEEVGVDIAKHRPMTFEELEDWEGLNFDLIVTLSPEAHHKALELTRTIAAEVEYWPTPDPTAVEGSPPIGRCATNWPSASRTGSAGSRAATSKARSGAVVGILEVR